MRHPPPQIKEYPADNPVGVRLRQSEDHAVKHCRRTLLRQSCQGASFPPCAEPPVSNTMITAPTASTPTPASAPTLTYARLE